MREDRTVSEGEAGSPCNAGRWPSNRQASGPRSPSGGLRRVSCQAWRHIALPFATFLFGRVSLCCGKENKQQDALPGLKDCRRVFIK